MNILIVGFGGIGKRHLEGILQDKKLSEINLNIDVVDIDKKNIKCWGELYFPYQNVFDCVINGDVPSIQQIACHLSIPENKTWDIAIVATNADVRYDVIMKIKSRCKYIILEKFLFNKSEEYKIDFSDNDVWVNCPRRAMNCYNSFVGKERIFVEYQHFSGLLSNSIHFMDLLAYLTGDNGISIHRFYVKKKIKTKRKGYYDAEGTIIASTASGNGILYLTAGDGFNPISAGLMVNDFRIDEIHKTIRDYLGNESDFAFQYQSQLTGKYISDIIETGKCGLVDYEISALWHLKILEQLRVVGWTKPIT